MLQSGWRSCFFQQDNAKQHSAYLMIVFLSSKTQTECLHLISMFSTITTCWLTGFQCFSSLSPVVVLYCFFYRQVLVALLYHWTTSCVVLSVKLFHISKWNFMMFCNSLHNLKSFSVKIITISLATLLILVMLYYFNIFGVRLLSDKLASLTAISQLGKVTGHVRLAQRLEFVVDQNMRVCC